MFRRKPPPEPEPTPLPEHPRIAAARELLQHGRDTALAAQVLDRVAEAIRSGEAERDRLDKVIVGLDPDKITGELKRTLRQRPSVTEPDSAIVLALRRRHEALHRVANQRDQLAKDIERTLTDAETLVASVLADADGAEIDAQLRMVTDEAKALAASHAEVSAVDEAARGPQP